jgi:predicted glutamine amidotransferase
MCRLALFNAATLHLCETAFGDAGGALSAFFWELERVWGGEGTGVAALWMGPHQRVRVRKGVRFTVEAAAAQVVRWEQQGAGWFLFHTRRASTGRIATEHCHPFRVGAFVLAHNGHDALWARLGQMAEERPMTDSETIARTWAALRLDPASLCELKGAFVGFHAGYPFVAKDAWSDLLRAQGAEGAILFASQLPTWLVREFDEARRLGEYCWMGGAQAFYPSRQRDRS